MDITIHPGKLTGRIDVIPSKSIAHRFLICAALSNSEILLVCPESSQDIEATVNCLNALGADIVRTVEGYSIDPIREIPRTAVLFCRESGSTLRFLLPIVGVLGIDATFIMEGRLPQRPLSPLWEEMERMGCMLTRPTENSIRCQGKLRPGNYTIDGSISSQFVTGLLLALPLINGKCSLEITGKIESRPYIEMTRQTMELFSVDDNRLHSQDYHTPGVLRVEGDWSNGAVWMAANALGSNIKVQNLKSDSVQGDRAAISLLKQLKENAVIDASDVPDLVPVLAVVAGTNRGAVFTNVQRLRLKESDRVAAVIEMIRALGGMAEATADTLTVYGTGLTGGTVDAHNDHRIAMAAAIAATVCAEPVTVRGAEAVNKSYPKFWEEYHRLGGNYEQYIR